MENAYMENAYMENKLYAYIDDNPTYAYPIIMGAVYSEEFNETIDSFSIIIDNVDSEHAIDLSKPYHIIKIVNKGTGMRWHGNNYIFMYSDSTMIKKTNIHSNIYCYTIELMNIIKAFENIQCPNLVITHDLRSNNPRKTIYDYINKYMSLYCPKIKQVNGNSWHYEYLFNWDALDDSPFNNTICADMQLNSPTLRELLTTLMLQVDCIPTMNYRELDYINFREKPSQFNYTNNGVTRFSLSNASDSYINSIVQEPSQVLDTDNLVVELAGFRNKNNPVLRQTENLELNTIFPIYSIEKVKMFRVNDTKMLYASINGYVDPLVYNGDIDYISHAVIGSVCISNTESYYNNDPLHRQYPIDTIAGSNNGEYTFYPKFFQDEENNIYLHLDFLYADAATYWHFGRLRNIKVHFCVLNSDGSYTESYVATTNEEDDWTLRFESSGVSTQTTSYGLGSFSRRLIPGGTIGNTQSYDASDFSPVVFGSQNFYNYYFDMPLGLKSLSNFTHIWIEYDCYDLHDDKNIYVMYPLVKIVPFIRDGTSPAFQEYDIYADEDTVVTTTIIACVSTGWWYGDIGFDYWDVYRKYFDDFTNPMKVIVPTKLPNYIDVTPLFIEQGKRNLLETNYLNMHQVSGGLENLAKYVYGTVGYNIGGKTITGFSQTYSYLDVSGLWDNTRSYIDNILKYIADNISEVQQFTEYDYNETFFVDYSNRYANMPTMKETIYIKMSDFDSFDFLTHYVNNKTEYVFEISYHPLNSFKMKWNKKYDYDYPIERLNNTASGLDDFKRLSKKAQSMVDRIGNAIYTITQTTNNIDNLQKVNSVFTDANGKIYTVFKREIGIERNYLTVTYYASEKYVMQNYFTSIITKYRAYQYVDYNQSVIRKENKTIHCLLAKDYYIDGDDNLIINDPLRLIMGILPYEKNKYIRINYLIEKSMNYYYDSANDTYTSNPERCKNDTTLLTYADGFCITTEDYDNVSAGIFLPDGVIDASYGSMGVRQQWQMWNQDRYNEKHYLTYANTINNFVGIYDYTQKFYANLPIVSISNDVSVIEDMQLCNNKALADEYIFYKDLAEVINFTLQFNFYTNESDICWCVNMFKNSPYIQQLSKQPNCVIDISDDEFICYEDEYLASATREFASSNLDDFIEIGVNSYNIPYIIVKWSSIDSHITQFAISNIDDNTLIDFIAFKRNSAIQDITYYLSFNDSKNNTAWKIYENQDYAGLFKRVKCKKGISREYEEN